MDTEEHIEFQKSIDRGHVAADEGSHYRELSGKGHAKNYRKIAYPFVTGSIGISIGAMFVLSGATDELVPGSDVAIIMTLGLLGGSLGLNHRLWRRIFDRIDLWFSRLLKRPIKASSRSKQSIEISKEKFGLAPIVTVVYPPDMADCPASDTYSRDKLASAKLALLNLDPAKTIRQ